MKKLFSFFILLAAFLLAFAGCASQKDMGVPYSTGPSASPSMNGPTLPLPQENENGEVEVMVEGSVN